MNLIAQGGPIMWPLLLLSIASIGCIVERVIFLVGLRVRQDKGRRRQLLTYLKAGHLKEAANLCTHAQDPVLISLRDANLSANNLFQISFAENASRLLERMHRGIPLLDTAITLAPLLGLLGTVIGLIQAFSAIGQAGVSSPVVVTGGIAEALLATAFGLGIAITCLLPYNFLTNKEDTLRQELEEIGTAVEKLLEEQK